MIIVGVTGGIGSGKSTVAKTFHSMFGIPMYISDDEAKLLMVNSVEIKSELIDLFGEEAYLDGALNKPYISHAIFNNKALLEQMNAIVHPRVAAHFKSWVDKQTSAYILKEAAILFESGADRMCDYIITVTLDKATKIERLLKRDKTSVEKIESIMKQQWSDDERIAKSDYVIVNDTMAHMEQQVKEIHREILKKNK
ncbi:dephospho-CoA kinase [Formosa agariphila KMM 3901]|uniref:Dephospho-CoA kinase n=1 Tax=Formosa agariphila (strain DSM 15362 / KCTC 12365 / LMG 23005 / KMM 3901 / M-2Alg 35-1) TaxID=1347342 RepID=T2KNM7_FORAG|nr:dephospho-CoA kinase [Formosa agariphila]CDF80073.1 dephospho-CoA kinase [Formosa agariphila KMM 3901]